MAFKKMRGCNLTYEKQGYIYFVCKNYKDQPEEVKEKIRSLCDEVGGEYSAALFMVLTSPHGARYVAMQNYISERHLYNLRTKFFEKW